MYNSGLDFIMNLEIRKQELALLSAFLRPEAEFSPKVSLIYGNPSTGKSTTVKHHLDSIKVKYSWIQCDECLSLKILWKRITQAINIDSGLVKRDDIEYDPLATSSFQGFITSLREFHERTNYDRLHYIVLDRADQIMEGSDQLFGSFVKLQEATQLTNLSIIIITTTLPKKLITSSVPTIFFENYTSEQVEALLISKRECHFPADLAVSPLTEQSFWESYCKLIVDSYFSYSTDINYLRKISKNLWDEFIKPIKEGVLQPHEFLSVYRRNFELLGSEYVVTDPALAQIESEVTTTASNLPKLSKYLLVSAYIASYNDPKQDWTLFSKLKEFRRTRRPNTNKRGNVSSKVEGSSFDLERMLAITHAIYNIDSTRSLEARLDLTTQIANLSNLKLILKSQNQDFISARTKWKVNTNFAFVKKIAEEIGFPIENYLTE